MPGIYKSKLGYYYISYVLDGKPRKKSTGQTSKKMANYIKSHVEIALTNTALGLPVPRDSLKRLPKPIREDIAGAGGYGNLPLRELIARYLAESANRVEASTLHTYQVIFKNFLTFLDDFDPDLRAELVDIFGGASNPAIVRLIAAAQRDRTYGEAFGYSTVSLDTVRKAVRLIAKSFIVSTGQV